MAREGANMVRRYLEGDYVGGKRSIELENIQVQEGQKKENLAHLVARSRRLSNGTAVQRNCAASGMRLNPCQNIQCTTLKDNRRNVFITILPTIPAHPAGNALGSKPNNLADLLLAAATKKTQIKQQESRKGALATGSAIVHIPPD
ncbi:hypothetical protein JTE90_022735 [Oedothorax gibbosus]|uniref:Uncharacterized protein n=1 Tax=Oedothorax gibbosus TaxID=931172 RepID=A0AAV6UPF6_9ARAC|nr:hypothetical protein JTE90_022735 [Oedothorax gibbosus]